MPRGIKDGDESDRGWFPEIAPAPFDQLTQRERQVVFYLAHGLYPTGIAPLIGTMSKTVDSHRLNAMKKLGTTNSVLLARLAIKAGFVSAHDADEPCTCGRTDGAVNAAPPSESYAPANGSE